MTSRCDRCQKIKARVEWVKICNLCPACKRKVGE
jgi:phage FluMu protein Com